VQDSNRVREFGTAIANSLIVCTNGGGAQVYWCLHAPFLSPAIFTQSSHNLKGDRNDAQRTAGAADDLEWRCDHDGTSWR